MVRLNDEMMVEWRDGYLDGRRLGVEYWYCSGYL